MFGNWLEYREMEAFKACNAIWQKNGEDFFKKYGELYVDVRFTSWWTICGRKIYFLSWSGVSRLVLKDLHLKSTPPPTHSNWSSSPVVTLPKQQNQIIVWVWELYYGSCNLYFCQLQPPPTATAWTNQAAIMIGLRAIITVTEVTKSSGGSGSSQSPKA